LCFLLLLLLLLLVPLLELQPLPHFLSPLSLRVQKQPRKLLLRAQLRILLLLMCPPTSLEHLHYLVGLD
jgi:hypothetical protein